MRSKQKIAILVGAILLNSISHTMSTVAYAAEIKTNETKMLSSATIENTTYVFNVLENTIEDTVNQAKLGYQISVDSIQEIVSENTIAEQPTYEGVTLEYSAPYNVSEKTLTKRGGVFYYNEHKETYYSEKVLPGGGLDIPGRHVADDGTIRDEDGYICVAADYDFVEYGETLMTSLGPAKVYDTGCQYGIIDIYVNW